MDNGPPPLADVLVVGAGMAGAAAARLAADAGLRVLALDKGRGPGGRLSTRRVEAGGFDHGAASLQAQGEDFRGWLAAQLAAGHAARWGENWVGVPGMNALLTGLLEGIEVRWSSTVAALDRVSGHWRALDAQGQPLAGAERLVLAVPAPQAHSLLTATAASAEWGAAGSVLLAALQAVRYAPCWAGLAVVEHVEGRAAPTCPDAAALAAAGLAAMIREGSKPGRNAAGHWVVHADADWSTRYLELSAEEAAHRLRSAFVALTGIDDGAIRSFGAHRWRYARPIHGLDPALAGAIEGLALAGDAVGWCAEAGTPPAEQAWRSGREAALRLLAARGCLS
ncbi:NAD(P)-binding protein [Silanimonas sp.]|uniref:NAD(P)/FAD-dependent oxidoreductase n=1 Tax=Silanimonas sp. TaxID=1929290 RepID=UPI001BBE648E|nr:NAD(P)-binding protein [Silanimonas sp.]MBS3896639.1 NAD(P)-binding protein [Silanimonas sp.]MBS3924694.1 NAD(P)-binding protein [Xanthomonadaceae bacterium]